MQKYITCKDCIHYDLCADFNLTVRADYTRNMQIVVDDGNPERCGFFKGRSKFIEQQTGEWKRHNPDVETMRAFHMAGIGKGMSENSIFWTCSACGGWGTPAYNYCSNCGAKMDKYRLGGGKELNV